MEHTPEPFDSQLQKDIISILELCRTDQASIAICSNLSKMTMDKKTAAIQSISLGRQGDLGRDDCFKVAQVDRIFPIVSLTKLLLAVAWQIAINKKAEEDDAYAKFPIDSDISITELYNQHSNRKMNPLPGSPSVKALFVHFKGLPSSDHRFLSPNGTPILSQTDALEDLVYRIADNSMREHETWSQYSNTNYLVIAMLIEVLWQGSLSSFMNKTLFIPLGMTSTSIGYPQTYLNTERCTVDSERKIHKIQGLHYRSDGAEAGAFGAYSNIQDLAKFSTFIRKSLRGIKLLDDLPPEIIETLFDFEATFSVGMKYNVLGISTNLDTTDIGSLSINRRRFPDDEFSRSPLLPKTSTFKYSALYMAGSTLGCNCALTVLMDQESSNDFAVVVLTNTSGPVDSADCVLRHIIQYLAQKQDREGSHIDRTMSTLGTVKRMMKKVCDAWRKLEGNPRPCVEISKDLTGVYEGYSFSQKLEIFKKDQSIFVTFGGSDPSSISEPLELLWKTSNSFQIVIPPHLSMDGEDDWLNLTFEVLGVDEVTGLLHDSPIGKDYFNKMNTKELCPTTIPRAIQGCNGIKIIEENVPSQAFDEVMQRLAEIMWQETLSGVYENRKDWFDDIHKNHSGCYTLRKAYKDRSEVGFVLSCYYAKRNCTWIYLLYVHKGFRKGRVGSELFKEVKKASLHPLVLGTNAKTEAYDFYKRMEPSSLKYYYHRNFCEALFGWGYDVKNDPGLPQRQRDIWKNRLRHIFPH